MEITIGVRNVAREISLESTQSPDEVLDAVRTSLADSAPLVLEDDKGRHVVVPPRPWASSSSAPPSSAGWASASSEPTGRSRRPGDHPHAAPVSTTGRLSRYPGKVNGCPVVS